MTTLDQHTTTSDPVALDELLDRLADTLTQGQAAMAAAVDLANSRFAECQQVLQAALDNTRAILAVVPTLESGGPGPLPACRLQRGQQIVHDGHWWHVAKVEHCEPGSVILTLLGVGRDVTGRPVVLDVDPDEIFTAAEPF